MNESRFSPAIALVAILSVIALITSIVAILTPSGSTAAPVALEDGAAPAGDTPADGDPAEVVPVSAEPGSGGTASVGLIEFAIEPDAIVLGPSGTIEVTVDFADGPQGFQLRSAGLLRTARLLARGEVFVPGDVWAGPAAR